MQKKKRYGWEHRRRRDMAGNTEEEEIGWEHRRRRDIGGNTEEEEEI